MAAPEEPADVRPAALDPTPRRVSLFRGHESPAETDFHRIGDDCGPEPALSVGDRGEVVTFAAPAWPGCRRHRAYVLALECSRGTVLRGGRLLSDPYGHSPAFQRGRLRLGPHHNDSPRHPSQGVNLDSATICATTARQACFLRVVAYSRSSCPNGAGILVEIERWDALFANMQRRFGMKLIPSLTALVAGITLSAMLALSACQNDQGSGQNLPQAPSRPMPNDSGQQR